MAVGVFSNTIRNVRQAKELAQRRQTTSYSNTIVHENPNYPDQAAQSSVRVDFNSNGPAQRHEYSNNLYQQDFSQRFIQNQATNPPPQSQLFNVGYSVSFTNGNKPSKPARYTKSSNLDDGEIITGTRKQNEEVEVPSVNTSPQDFVSTSLIDSKKHRISGIKPKPHFITNYPNPKLLLTQANLSPTTQKYYKVIEQTKPQVQNVQELQQNYSWRNLSPGVEIIKSTEVPTGKYSKQQPSLHFDHAKALGRSQDFDFSNALSDNSKTLPQQNVLFAGRKIQPQVDQHLQENPLSSKLPIDTGLLREPVQIDTRLLEEAMRQQLALYAHPKYTQTVEQPVQNVNYLQQFYKTIPVQESSHNRPIPVFYQPEQQGLQNYQTDQNRFQFKVYGKPQPVNPYTDQSGEAVQRQPRYLTMSDLNTNLRPPVFDTPYQKRIRVG